MHVKFSGSCLKQDKITFNHGKTVNVYIVCDLKSSLNNFDPTLPNSLFGAIKLTKNNDTRFNPKGTFLHPSGGTGVNVVIFGADMGSSVHANNRTESILILDRSLTERPEDTALYAEKMYSFNFTATRKKFCLSLHYNGDNSCLSVAQRLLNLKLVSAIFIKFLFLTK